MVDVADRERGQRRHARVADARVRGRVLGPVKANNLAVKIKTTFPAIADGLLAAGVDLSLPATASFLDGLVGDGIGQSDVDALKSYGKREVSATSPPRFDLRFEPSRWPHVAADGGAGAEDDPPIHGFPNSIEKSDFEAAWRPGGVNGVTGFLKI